MTGETNLKRLLKGMKPKLNDGEYIFSTVPGNEKLPVQPVMQFREEEGITLIVDRKEADNAGITYETVFSWITLTVHSSLDAVGFTTAFSSALADEGISCNVVAGYFHDHLFVHKRDAEKAMSVLKELGI